MFVPHTPRHFDSHLGRWSIYHCPGTRNLFTLLHQGFQLSCSGACIQVWVCVCVQCEDTQLSSFLSTGFLLYPADPCAHVHKCSLVGSSCGPLCLYVSVSVNKDVKLPNVYTFLSRRVCGHVQQCMCIHAHTCLVCIGMSMRILISLLMKSSCTCGYVGSYYLSPGEGIDAHGGHAGRMMSKPGTLCVPVVQCA